MYLLQTSRIDLGFIGGAEIDRFGNLNTHWVYENGKQIRLPGSGGAADIATMAKRCIIIMNHEKRPRRDLATGAIGASGEISLAADRAELSLAWASFRSIP